MTYTDYTFLNVGYTSSVTFGGSTGPGALVVPGGAGKPGTSFGGSSWSSLSVRLVYHDSNDQERQGLAVRAMHRVLAPQLLENPITFMITDISSTTAMRLAVDQAAETGE